MPFKLFSQDSALEKTLKAWIKNPTSEISEKLRKISNPEVKAEAESKLICQALGIIKSQLQASFDEKTENNIYELTVLFQSASTKEAANYLNDIGIPLLIDILSAIELKQYKSESFFSCAPMMLKMFAVYKNQKGWNKLAECVKSDFKNEEYMWSVILNAASDNESKYDLIIQALNGKIPSGFLGISYLDMCNAIAIRTNTFKHPFNSPQGFAFLDAIVKNNDPAGESYIVSATASIPFLAKEYQDSLLETVSKHKSIDIQMEAAWAGAKMGGNESVDKLAGFAKDYRYSTKAISYLNELHLENRIPNEIQAPDFQALSEMCNWLAHPNEYGAYPDHAEIFYKTSLYWPPTKDVRPIYLIKYTYKNHKEDGSDDVGIGLVGSVTFSLFGLQNMLTLKPVELLAIHCNWELEKENYQDIKSGIALLKKHNKDIE
ncbi:hypothetical protein KK083_03760 [Fulvivirgaceae bacterium PWU4]|uniref:Uncharacterized protein n=1 Tax=Chryseosolibacter histidini TaxID=2782349 RepID=A0AAP2GLM5_9BACT|nr:hypothetical protein [Chryseosolibacter histidini]MBT1695978.1 hypothetical protein [Chryseosolibacter histidini]